MESRTKAIIAAMRAAEFRLEFMTNDRIHAMAGSHGSLNIAILKLIDLVVEEVLKGTDIALSFKNARDIDLDRLIRRMIECADTFLVDRANAALLSAVILYFAGTDPRTGVPAGNRKLGALCRVAAGVPRGGVVNIPSPKLGNKVSGFAAVNAIFTRLGERGLTSVNGNNIPFGAIGTLYMHSVLGEDIVLPEVIANGTEAAVRAMCTAMEGMGMMMCDGMSHKLSAALIGAAAMLELVHPDANVLYEGSYIPSSHMVGKVAARVAGLPETIHMRMAQKAFVTGNLIGDLGVLLKDSGAVTVVCIMNIVDMFSMFEEWLTWTGGPTITPIASLGGEAWIAMNYLLEQGKTKEETVELLSPIRNHWFDPEISRVALNIIVTKALEFGSGPVSEVLKEVTEATKTWGLYERAERAYDMLKGGAKVEDVVRSFEDGRKEKVEKNSSAFCSRYFGKRIEIHLLRVEPLGRIAKKGEGIGRYWALDPDVDVRVVVDDREFVLEKLCQVWIPRVAVMEAEEYRVAVESAAIFVQELSYSGVLLFNITVPVCVAVALEMGTPKDLAKRASDVAYLSGAIPGSQMKGTSSGAIAKQLLKGTGLTEQAVKDAPLVSCIMVTKDPCRWELLKNSVACFSRQTQPRKQLLIVCDGTREYNDRIADFVKNQRDIKHVAIPEKQGDKPFTLGFLRNVGLENADGDFIMQWDDDDLHHETRIEVQLKTLLAEGSNICLMKDYLLKLSDKAPEAVKYPKPRDLPQGHPGTILFRRTSARYECLGKHEDTVFLERLIKAGYKYSLVEGQPHLFTYCYQGRNTFSYNHFLVLKKLQNKAIGLRISEPAESREDPI